MSSDMLAENVDLENKVLQRMLHDMEQDLNLAPSNLTQKALAASAIRLKWYRTLIAYQDRLRKVKKSYEAALKKFVIDQQHNSARKILAAQAHNEFDKCTEGSAFIVAIDREQEIITFLQGALQIFSEFGYTIKNSLEALKLEKQS